MRLQHALGVAVRDGQLYESTGQVGRSTIRRVRLQDGRTLQSVPIPPGQFGEGIVNWQGEIVSITWKPFSGSCLVAASHTARATSPT